MKQTRNRRSLPEEIIEEILSWLPVKTLLRFKSASKSLFNLIISPEFVILHLRRSLIRNSTLALLCSRNNFTWADLDQPQGPVPQLDIHPVVIKLPDSCRHYEIIGICNGVVCFSKAKEFVLYNPATRAYKRVPKAWPQRSHEIYSYEFLAYDCISDDFKIFSYICYKYDDGRKYYGTYFYKLKDNSWSKNESPPRGYQNHLYFNHIANNSVYWRTFRSGNYSIMRLDVSSHRYEVISLPIQVKYPWNIDIGVLKGRLHVITKVNSFDIWILKEEDNCWTRVFSCSNWEYEHLITRIYLSPYAYSKDGRKIIIGRLVNFKKVICCDLESQTMIAVDVVGLPEDVNFVAIPWTESLVPLA